MKRMNPLFHEEDNPIDALEKVGFILGFLRDFQGDHSGGLSLGPRGREGFIFLVSLLEDTTMQISDALLEKEKVNK